MVVKVPRFAFEKFPGSNPALTTSMKSVGETMAIGKTFQQSLQKALRSLEIGRGGFGADGKDAEVSRPFTDESLENALRHAGPIRIFHIHEAFARGWSVERIRGITQVDPWFLNQLHELVAFEGEIRASGSLAALAADLPLFRQTKEFGYSDRQIAFLIRSTEADVRATREKLGLAPVYGLVDTCAAEFKAFTPYFYSTWSTCTDLADLGTGGTAASPSAKKKIMILGGGPNRIGQGIEFDYCCVHAAFAIRDAGFESIMVNCNPETVSTDYDTSDKLYFEPLTLEDVLSIYEKEKPEGVIVQFGGQTPLNLAEDLAAAGVKIIGTSPATINLAEDRDRFREIIRKLAIPQPESGMACNTEEALEIAAAIGYPLMVRPSFVLGGRAMEVVRDEEMLRFYMAAAVEVSPERPILIDKFLENAIEAEADAICDGKDAVVPAVMEHIELAGVHSGDSACVIPPISIAKKHIDTISDYTRKIAIELNVRGVMNIQYAIANDTVYILEANPRASRTVPLVSKICNIPMARLATQVVLGSSIADLSIKVRTPDYFGVKESVFPFNMFPEVDPVLGPEMRSTGEVLGLADSFGLAFFKAQEATQGTLPLSGSVLFTIADIDKPSAIEAARLFRDLDFKLFGTEGTRAFFAQHGIEMEVMKKIGHGRPDIVDHIKNGEVNLVINTPSGKASQEDDSYIRKTAIRFKIPYITTMAAAVAAAKGIQARREKDTSVCSLQDYHARS